MVKNQTKNVFINSLILAITIRSFLKEINKSTQLWFDRKSLHRNKYKSQRDNAVSSSLFYNIKVKAKKSIYSEVKSQFGLIHFHSHAAINRFFLYVNECNVKTSDKKEASGVR